MILDEWAAAHGIPLAALVDLKKRLGAGRVGASGGSTSSEAAVQNLIRLEASRVGARVWRNNVGACYTNEGSFLRYGLANDSKQMNKKLKSSDLIGIKPVKITRGHVGRTIGQFVAREVKAGGWRYTGTERETAQADFLSLVISLGGDACFASCEGTL